MITLECGKEKYTVTIDRATSLLKIQKEMRLTGWQLPPNYIFKDGVIIRTSQGISKGKAKTKGDRERDIPPGPAKVSHGDDNPKG